MIVIADTTPLRYLIEIGEVELLAKLFGQVIIPPAVYDELQDARTPPAVRAWMQAHPAWLVLRQADTSLFIPQQIIGAGEREALALALELKADAVLMDDQGARREADRLNLRTIPTFLLLEQAALADLLEPPEAINKMRQTGFYFPPAAILQAMLERDQQRRQAAAANDHQPPDNG